MLTASDTLRGGLSVTARSEPSLHGPAHPVRSAGQLRRLSLEPGKLSVLGAMKPWSSLIARRRNPEWTLPGPVRPGGRRQLSDRSESLAEFSECGDWGRSGLSVRGVCPQDWGASCSTQPQRVGLMVNFDPPSCQISSAPPSITLYLSPSPNSSHGSDLYP